MAVATSPNVTRQPPIVMLALAALALPLGGCMSASDTPPSSGPGWASHARTRPVTHLIVHHTAADLPTSLRILSGGDPARRVSAHYLVTDEPEPRVVALVPETRVAYHAGVSHWRGVDSLNEVSIGIEIVHPDGDLSPYREAQVVAVGNLLRELAARHGVDGSRILAHSDVSPGRKHDPGRFFPWERLHRDFGVGLWPDSAKVAAYRDVGPPPSSRHLAALLRLLGYRVTDEPGSLRAALASFQRHWRPDKVDGEADRETVARLRALLDPR